MKRFPFLLLMLGAVLGFLTQVLAEEPAKEGTPKKLGESQVKRSGKTFVLVYLEENFKGKVYRVEVPAELANDARLKELGIPNDSIQSLKIPDGVVVTLFDNAGFGGTNQSYTGKVATLGVMKGLASSLKAEFKPKP